jgi:membrane peptidoglycan carboxypeptidase
VIDERGNLVRVTEPSRKQIISSETASTVREAFEGVVLRGTGRRAALEGYRCAGKTGTAQKIVNGQYSDTKYLASFIGFAPLPVPKIVALVQIDEPRGKIYGGDAAAPVFARIVQEVLIQMKIPPDKAVTRPVINPRLALNTRDYFPNATPVAPIQLTGENGLSTDTVDEVVLPAGPDSLVMPDLHGLAKRQVILRCQALGLHLQMKGTGAAVAQDPLPGTVIGRGDFCRVTFARELTRNGTGPSGPGTADNSDKTEAVRRSTARQR